MEKEKEKGEVQTTSTNSARVHIKPGSYGVARLNGTLHCVTEEYLYSEELLLPMYTVERQFDEALETLMQTAEVYGDLRQHKGYLGYPNLEGEPLYKDPERYALGMLNISGTQLDKLQKVNEARKWLYANYSEEQLGYFHKSYKLYWQLSHIPEDQRKKAIDEVLAQYGLVGLFNGQGLERWRKENCAEAPVKHKRLPVDKTPWLPFSDYDEFGYKENRTKSKELPAVPADAEPSVATPVTSGDAATQAARADANTSEPETTA